MKDILQDLVRKTTTEARRKLSGQPVNDVTLAKAKKLANAQLDKLKKKYPMLNQPEFYLDAVWVNHDELTIVMSEDLQSCVKYADDVERMLYPSTPAKSKKSPKPKPD